MVNLIAGTYFHGNVSDIEILWTFLAIIGLAFSFHNVSESRKDLDVLRERGIRNGRWKIAMTALKAEVGRGIIQFIFMLIGIMAMLYPEPPAQIDSFKLSIYRFIFQWGFIASSVILVLKSYWNYQLRRELIEHGIKLEPHETENGNGNTKE